MEPGPALAFVHVSYEYPDGTRALDDVHLSIAPGERVALLGPNGAGKSTLMLHANGVLRARSGEVLVGGTPITDATVREARRRVGLVFQDPDDQLFMTSVFDDVAFGPQMNGLEPHEVEHRVHDALHAVGLADLASKGSHRLSFGQKKRVALATVLSMQPDVLVLDEPTSNLDPRSRRHMIELMASLDATLLVATHDMDLAWTLAERAVVLDGGRVVADGPAREVLRDAALLEAHGLEMPHAACERS
ncbi:energy-coupling factor ABC transporter ATP-binding protein [Coriobacteriia bacterium Es71-Z0120]|uniref:energy-coupling factor ABC transporter ATP-binding protein n=1 Tax=Parvivirga hydrogeniphila TaxID=2939460 RepID=UPI002260EECD|nr:ABC transporter ATP-binding protein [Parvivirga hydrogeniphila]MCL4078357.1 energy-coupling factor ABC transporter ATP-binding protein [Parvivirga hydrogeniphila]